MRRELTVFDSICLIFGIIVGAGIYETAPIVAAQFSSWSMVLGVWLLGGLLSLAGALCYAELAAMYPKNGGDYIYLKKTYGDVTGWLFAWSRILIIRPGSIASMAFPFATYFKTIWSPLDGGVFEQHSLVIYACCVVVVMTLLNCLQLNKSKWAQNLLSFAKFGGLGLVLLVPVLSRETSASFPILFSESVSSGGFGFALILVLFTYGGWSEIAYVAAEVRRPERNILNALVYGTVCVTVLYLLVNAAFIFTLGLDGVAQSHAVATDTVARVLPGQAAVLVSVLICISTLGAINGLILTGARISCAVGSEHRLFRSVSTLSSSGVPVSALGWQAVLTIAIILLSGSFQGVIIYTTAVVWLFFSLVGFAVIVLRWKLPRVDRPYRVTAYPVTVILFCASSIFLTYSAVVYDPRGSIICILLLLTGVPAYYLSSYLESGAYRGSSDL